MQTMFETRNPNIYIKEKLQTRNMSSGCQKSCPKCFCFFPSELFSAVWLLQITVHCIFSASCLSFQSARCHLSWQTRYAVINNASCTPTPPHTLRCCFIFRSSHSSCFMENTGEQGRWASASHLVGRHLQQLDNNGLETTLRPQWSSCLCSGNGGGGLIHGQPHLQSPFAQRVQTTSRGNHLTHFHPISTAECVHFQANGMSFCWSLWSRINPGIKTDFPGSNLPSSIDFFTLTEPVLPNLTWQPAAQWTGSTLASHRGSSPPPLHEVKERLGRRKERTPRCIERRALLTENREVKRPSLCFTSNYVF